VRQIEAVFNAVIRISFAYLSSSSWSGIHCLAKSHLTTARRS